MINKEWELEPDRLEFEHAGFPCLINRNENMGFLCGYVAMPPGHPWHGKDYDDVDATVHGGLTYGNMCQGEICHKPKPGEPDDVYWLGFDCGHAWDFLPMYCEKPEIFNIALHAELETYRNIAYVKQQCEQLAEQAKAAQEQALANA